MPFPGCQPLFALTGGGQPLSRNNHELKLTSESGVAEVVMFQSGFEDIPPLCSFQETLNNPEY